MANGFLTGTAETGRWVAGIATLGLSTAINGGIKDLSHECIEIVYTCECCSTGNWQRFTAEIECAGQKSFECGYYSIEKDARHTWKPPTPITVAYVESKYNEMGTSYNLVDNNCSHWSSRLWYKL